jgi:quercetin dioxygenase-like cupin family protein
MAVKGESISNKKTGEKVTWIETAADTNGERLVFLFEVAPKGELPVTHFHPNQTETFEIKEGSIKLNVDGEEKTLRVGEIFTVPENVPHRWWNDSANETVKLIATFRPALNTETFLEQFYGLGNDDKTKPDGTPNFLQLMAMVRKYELFVAGPPVFVQKIMSIVLGTIGRLFGYKSYYPKYSK